MNPCVSAIGAADGAPGSVAWESQERLFRVCLFDGPDASMECYEFAEDSVAEVLERGPGLSLGNTRLWSMGLMLNREDEGRGLLWLDGMDYRVKPQTRLEWRARGAMQNRYLMERARRVEEVVLPSGLRSIRMSLDYGRVLPLWEGFVGHYTVDRGRLPLSDRLSDDLEAWQRSWHDSSMRGGALPKDFLKTGWLLYERLQIELDGIAEVRPEFA